MFTDEITVEVFAGDGGNGMASYRREKYVPFGGPSGGNGGDGGDIVFVGAEGMTNLYDLRYRRHIRAQKGEHGKSKGMNGKNAEHTFINVPLGTICYDEHKNKIGEITKNNEELIVAKGGKGGRGNISLATHKNPAPNFAENGDTGEVKKIYVVLKVLADVGLIGFPSVGKSTFLSVVSNAKPKIAEYPFTTLNPNLGMVDIDDETFVLADLPGLIENAHQGLGLGIKFLKHIERCKIFVHLIDATTNNYIDDYNKIRYELKMYDEKLLERKEIVVINKIDQGYNEDQVQLLEELINDQVYLISAYKNENIKELLYKINETYKLAPEIKEEKVFVTYTYEEEKPFKIDVKDNVYYVTGERLKVLFDRTDFTKDEAVRRFAKRLRDLGVDDELRRMGAKNKDIVDLFGYEFEFIE